MPRPQAKGKTADPLVKICKAIEKLAEQINPDNKEQGMYDVLGLIQDATECPLPPRSRTEEEIGEAIDELWDRVWYNRHMCHHLDDGHINRDGMPRHNGGVGCAAAIEKEKKYPGIGDHDDFEYGMINGKLSALRWVLGDDWDFLDT